jgi:hypothetical protein
MTVLALGAKWTVPHDPLVWRNLEGPMAGAALQFHMVFIQLETGVALVVKRGLGKGIVLGVAARADR